MQTYKRFIPDHTIRDSVLGIDAPHGSVERLRVVQNNTPKYKAFPQYEPEIMRVYQRTERKYKWRRRWFWIRQGLFWLGMFGFVGFVIVFSMYILGNWS